MSSGVRGSTSSSVRRRTERKRSARATVGLGAGLGAGLGTELGTELGAAAAVDETVVLKTGASSAWDESSA